jgi:hypothetical protein
MQRKKRWRTRKKKKKKSLRVESVCRVATQGHVRGRQKEVVKINRWLATFREQTGTVGPERASENVDEDGTKGEAQKYRKDEEERLNSLLPANTTSI